MMGILQKVFPILAILSGVLAYYQADIFTPYKSSIIYLLASIMFCMGTSLTFADFKRAFGRINILLLTLILQFGFMPFIAWQLSRWANLDVLLTTGMILVGSVSGGTASNVMCYLCKGDVALSISLTAISTALAIFVTPMLVYFYCQSSISIPVSAMMMNILYMVVAPVSLGLILNNFSSPMIAPVQRYGADFSIILICLVIAIVVALNHDNLLILNPLLVMLVLIHNLSGLLMGFLSTYVLTRDSILSKTVALEVGMQNSGLAVALAVKFFGGTAALPGALFSIIHNVTGSLFARLSAQQNYKR
jgi:BASS family bile acid:Na+ symporter